MDAKRVSFDVILRCTKERFKVRDVSIRMKIHELKGLLEFICGIPSNIQKLYYLDEGEMIESKDIYFYDIIEGATVNMDVFIIYAGLIKAVANGNFEEALKQGVSLKVSWNSPAADYMFQRERTLYIKERAGIALFVASHRGNLNFVKSLFEHDVNINYQTAYGRTAIMVSVVNDKIEIVDFLLQNNADIDLCDIEGETVIDIARKFNNKIGQNSLLVFKWKKRASSELSRRKRLLDENGGVLPIVDDRFAFQMHDSSKKTWLKGDFVQFYMSQVKKAQEFSGSGFSAPRAFKSAPAHKEKKSDNDAEDQKLHKQLSYEKWLQEKKKKRQLEKLIKKDIKKPVENNVKTTKQNQDYEDDLNEDEKLNGSKFKSGSFRNKKSDKTVTKLPNLAKASSIKQIKDQVTSENYDVYYGMPYDEWTKLRDRFLQAHSML